MRRSVGCENSIGRRKLGESGSRPSFLLQQTRNLVTVEHRKEPTLSYCVNNLQRKPAHICQVLCKLQLTAVHHVVRHISPTSALGMCMSVAGIPSKRNGGALEGIKEEGVRMRAAGRCYDGDKDEDTCSDGDKDVGRGHVVKEKKSAREAYWKIVGGAGSPHHAS